MDKEYELKPWSVGEGYLYYELVRTKTRRTPLEKLIVSKKRNEDIENLVGHIKTIIEYGVQKSCSACKLECLDGSLGLYEIKHYAGIYRYLSYIEIEGPTIVLLYEARGHQGSGNIHNDINHVQGMVKEAKILLEELDETEGIKNNA